MTHCAGVIGEDGLVFASDHIAALRKMFVFEAKAWPKSSPRCPTRP